MKMEIGNWKWSSSIHATTKSIFGNNTVCIEYLEVAGPSSISMYIEKLGEPEDEASTQLTSLVLNLCKAH